MTSGTTTTTTDNLLLAASEVAIVAGGKSKRPRISIVAYSGGLMAVPGWGPVAIDLTGLEAGGQVPLLADHNATISGAVGHGEAGVVDGRLIVTGVMSGTGEATKHIVAMTAGGFSFQASVGVEAIDHERVKPGEKVRVNGRTLSSARGFALIKSGRLREVSITPLGADAGTSVAIAASRRKEPYMTKTQDSVAADEQTIQAQERDRIKHIDRLCAGNWANRGERVQRLRAQAIDGDISIEQLQAGLLHELRASRPVIGVTGGGDRPAEGQVIRAAAARNMGVPEKMLGEHYGENAAHEAVGSRYDGMGLHAIMRHVVLAAGRSVPHNATDLVRSAFDASRAVQASGTSTMSLPGILSDSAHKSALAAYRAVPTVWSMLAATTSLTNFKPHKRYRMTGIGRFEEVGNAERTRRRMRDRLGCHPGHEVPAARARGRHHALAFVTQAWDEVADLDAFDRLIMPAWLMAVERWAARPIRMQTISPPPRPQDIEGAEAVRQSLTGARHQCGDDPAAPTETSAPPHRRLKLIATVKDWHETCDTAGMRQSTRYDVLAKLRERGVIIVDGESIVPA